MALSEFYDESFCAMSADVNFELDIYIGEMVQFTNNHLIYPLRSWNANCEITVHDFRVQVLEKYSSKLEFYRKKVAWALTVRHINAPAAVGVQFFHSDPSKKGFFSGKIVLLDTVAPATSQLSYFKYEALWPMSKPTFMRSNGSGTLILTDADHPAVIYPQRGIGKRFVFLNDQRHEVADPVSEWRSTPETIIWPFLLSGQLTKLQMTMELV